MLAVSSHAPVSINDAPIPTPRWQDQFFWQVPSPPTTMPHPLS
jgi:hypothetical protein